MTYVARSISIILCLCILSAMPSFAQIYDIREMATVDFRTLDLEHTVIIIPAGVFEQHGPYLPSYTDGYRNEFYAQRVAESIVARADWTVLMFPQIPLGVGGANTIGKKHVFPGTYHVHFSTLRAMFMDLTSEFGEAGFRWIFVISHHGSPDHQRALEQSGDFFQDVYGGKMVYLKGLIPDEPVVPELNLSSEEHANNGLDVHGGMSETSDILFLRPDLVRSGYRTADPLPGDTMRSLVTLAAESDWPGYFGAPHLATASRGATAMAADFERLSSLALRILDGFDHRSLQRRSDLQLEDEATSDYVSSGREHARRIRETQQKWLESRSLQ